MVLGLLAAGSLLAAGAATADAQRDKNNPQWDPKEGGYGGAKTLEQRITQYITQGGRPEYQEATSQPKTFTVYNEPYAKQNGAEFGTFEYYKAPDGTYTRDLAELPMCRWMMMGKSRLIYQISGKTTKRSKNMLITIC